MEPTNDTALTSGWVSSPSTATLSPLRTLNTPSGSPASAHSSGIHSAADGTFSLGLRMTVLPAAMAIGKNHIGTMAGKLNGLMTADQPSGWRIEDTSTRVEAFSVNPPLSRCGMPQANSTTSWPRATSPRASASTLPCSAVMSSASSSARALSSSRKRNRIWVRRASDVSRQPGNAAFAAATAASTSAGAANASRAVIAPVAGSVTSENRTPVPSWFAPATQWWRARTVDSPSACATPAAMAVVIGSSVAARTAHVTLQSVSFSTSRLTQWKPRKPMYPTLAEVLDLPVLRAAAPRVRAGSGALDVPVRWVHVSELLNPAGTLTGGELVLSIGVHLADPATDLPGYVASLRDAGAVGLVVELGQHVRSLPDPLVQAARALGFPLVELRRTVRYVEVTEVVHSMILNSQFARLRFTQRVHDAFRTLSVEGGGAGRVLAEAAALTELPVVLEDLGHRALSFAAGEMSTASLLTDWTARSRQVPAAAHTATAGPEGWTTTPVGPRARRWGRLVVPRRVVGADAAETVALVLEHAADALTIGRLLGDDPIGPELEAQGELLEDLLRSTALDEHSLRARARALGLPAGGALTAVVVDSGGDDKRRGDHDDADDADPVQAVAAALRTAGVPAIVGRLAAGRVGVVVSSRSRDGETATLARVAELLPATTAVVGAAGPVPAFSDVAAAVTEAAFVVDVAAAMRPASGNRPRARLPQPRRIWRSTDLGARGLLWQLRADPRLQSFVDAQLAPLLRLDDPERTTMLETLLAYLDAGGVVTVFARAVQLSRPGAYARLDRLRALLGCDLEHPRTRLSLHLALLALDFPATSAG